MSAPLQTQPSAAIGLEPSPSLTGREIANVQENHGSAGNNGDARWPGRGSNRAADGTDADPGAAPSGCAATSQFVQAADGAWSKCPGNHWHGGANAALVQCRVLDLVARGRAHARACADHRGSTRLGSGSPG